jgi:hypothetical protein
MGCVSSKAVDAKDHGVRNSGTQKYAVQDSNNVAQASAAITPSKPSPAPGAPKKYTDLADLPEQQGDAEELDLVNEIPPPQTTDLMSLTLQGYMKSPNKSASSTAK